MSAHTPTAHTPTAHTPTDATSVARARPVHRCDVALVFYLVFETMKRLGRLVHDGMTVEVDGYGSRLRVNRMGLTELGKRFTVNTEYLDEIVSCFTSIDAPARVNLVREALSRTVHAAIAAYLRDPIKTFITKYVLVCLRTGDGACGDGACGDGACGDGACGDGACGDGAKVLYDSHHVAWNDRVFPDMCALVLSYDTEEHRFQYWDPWWCEPLEVPAYGLRRNVKDEDQRRMVQVHMDYLMGRITGTVVDAFDEQLQLLSARKAKRAHARAKTRFLADNQDA